MSDHQRRTAFAIGAAILAATVALLGALESPHHDRRSPPAKAHAHHPVVLGGTAPARRPPPRRPPATTAASAPTPHSEHAMVAVAARFAQAFARYESGRLAPAVRHELEQTATTEFAHQLLAAPPTVPHGARRPSPTRVLSVSPSDHQPAEGAIVSVELGSQGTLGALTLQMHDPHGQWRVSGLG